MRIRSITAFASVTWPIDEGTIASVSRFLTDARLRLNKAGCEVQKVALATPPFMDVVGDPDVSVLLEFAQAVEAVAARHNIDVVSIGPLVATTPLALLMPIHALPQLMAETTNVYSGVLFADDKSGINLSAARAFAETIHEVAQSTPNGLGNLRLGALANVPAGIPYFPAAYHHGGPARFSIATEAADLVLEIVSQTGSLSDVRKRVIKAIETISTDILGVVDNLVDDHQIGFNGIDFCLTPSPAQSKSIGASIERLGVDAFGGSGTLFVIAFLASCIRRANVPLTGFSGMMLSILEDDVLAHRAAEGRFSVNDLLLYSAAGGVGPDAIPIPGNTRADEIGAIFLDMAALSVAQSKPLMARLLPIPHLNVGEKVSFNSEDLVSTRILPVKNLGAKDLFERGGFLQLRASQ